MLLLNAPGADPAQDSPAALRAARDAAIHASQLAMRDSTRLMRLLTILGEPLTIDILLDRALATLSELFAADIVVLLDPVGSGNFVPLAAVGLPEESMQHAFSDALTSHVAQALRTGMPVLSVDVERDAEVDASLRELGAEAIVWLPVSGSHGTRGVLILARCRAHPFDHGDVGLLRAMAYRIGIALEQAQRRTQLEIMVRAGQQIGCLLDQAEVGHEAVRMFPAVINADAAILVLHDAAGQVASLERSRLDSAWDALWCGLSRTYLERAAGEPDWLFATANLAAEASLHSLPSADCPALALLAVPIRHQDHPRGMLFALRFTPTVFTPDALQIAKLYAGQVASALENASLCQALRDDLSERGKLQDELRRSKQQVESLLATRTLQLDAAHKELWAQKQEYQQLYDAAPCGYHSLDPNGVFLKVNATEQQMLGYSAEQMVGRMNISDVIAPHCRHLVAERWKGLMARGHAEDQQYSFVRQDGSMFAGVLNGLVLRDAQGHVVSTRCVLFDDSERIAKERHIANLNVELEKRAIAAEAANRAKSQFLATMSHEVRTPLNAITGFTELLKMRVTVPDQVDKLNKVLTASKNLLGILDGVLEVARLDASGALALENAEFEFDALLRGVVEAIDTQARAKGLAFNLEMGLLPRVLCGDARRVGEILRAILDNAIKFTDQGRILLRGLVVEEGLAHAVLRFEVQDTGIGIAPENVKRIFEAFEQEDNSSTRGYGGAGLGLTIARRLARLMGGEVGVNSTPGVGSTFWVTLHLDKPDPAGTIGDSPEATGRNAEAVLKRDFSGTCVLVAEDDPINQEVMIALLSDTGLRCDIAADGLIALEKARARAYPLILMDMKMPHLDGLGATRQIRRLAKHEHTPIVAVTANTSSEDRAECARAGMNDYLAKPVDPDLLFATLLKWLSANKAACRE
jgi:PAS domain S-box-containing protein